MSTGNVYDQGDLIRVTGTFKNDAGANADPTTVAFKVKNPAGTVTTYAYPVDGSLIKSATGIYYVDVDTSSADGQWMYRWEATGSGQAATEGWFYAKTEFP